MRTEPSSGEERKLNALLHEWKIDSSLPPRFDEQVWHRIERSQRLAESIPAMLGAWVAGLLLRPSVAVTYATVLLALGLAGGLWQGHAATHRVDRELSEHYVQMIDPYQMPRN